MRRDYKNGVLEKEYMERLEAIGITWDIADRQWEEYYGAARCYYQEHGNLRIAPKYTASDGTRLGLWIQRMRKKYKQKKLTGEDVSRLEAIGMIWSTSDHIAKSIQDRPLKMRRDSRSSLENHDLH